ncbi:hypothetical protein ACLB2K_075989 [Fragaria x ananassa]
METTTPNMSIQPDEDKYVSTMNQTQNPNLVTNQITSIQQEQQDGDASPLNQTNNPNAVMSNPIAEDETTLTTTENQNRVSDLPNDILAEILKLLPAKTLVRFKCVCKPWGTLLTDSIFIKSHLERNRTMFQSDLKTNTRLILARYCDTLLSTVDSEAKNVMQAEDLDFPLLKNLPYYVKGHSDGLLCLVVNDGDEGMLVVYDPSSPGPEIFRYGSSIQQYRKLPNPADFRSTREAIGIGFDDKIKDYKVVRVPSNYCKMKVPGYKPKVEVLELKANTWRQIPDEDILPYYVEHIFQSNEVNGGLYWLVEDNRRNSLIMRFDLAEEKFKVVKHPPEEFKRNVSWIGPLKDLLCVVHTRRLSEVHVWATNDDMTWRKIMTSSKYSEPPASDLFKDTFRYMPLCYTEKGDNVYCESLVLPGVGVHQTEAAASSGTAINYLTAEDEAEEDNEEQAENSSSVLRMMSSLKRELANLLACTAGLSSRHAQG